jgi:putative membrane protein
MFIDYVALMLVDLVIAMALVALYFAKYINEDPKVVAPGFLLAGFIGLVTGLHMIYRWPLPGSFNIAFGELSVMFGVLLIGAAVAFLAGWDLLSIGVYALLAGIAGVVVGVRIFTLKMTKEPLVSALGFVATGVTGILSLPAYLTRKNPVIRILATLAAVGAFIIWAITGYASYWSHLEGFAKWKPLP